MLFRSYGIACVDKRSGALRWSVPPKDRYGRGLNPQVSGGIVYAVDSEGIEFYDADRGEYLGRSGTVTGDVWQLKWTTKYSAPEGDLLIIDDGEKFNAVLMNLVRGSDGQLRKK